jgi:hypothetical protein
MLIFLYIKKMLSKIYRWIGAILAYSSFLTELVRFFWDWDPNLFNIGSEFYIAKIIELLCTCVWVPIFELIFESEIQTHLTFMEYVVSSMLSRRESSNRLEALKPLQPNELVF